MDTFIDPPPAVPLHLLRRRRPARVLAMCGVVLVATGCGASEPEGPNIEDLENDPVLAAAIRGTAGARVTERRDGESPALTVLMDVVGEWNAVSVELARVASSSGWDITSVNCVGTGNDVIGRKLIRDRWVLLESGAGTRGAGIILRLDPDQSPSGPFTATGRCPQALVGVASGG